ncbi:hypothetical protein [Desulfovibrio sp.]|uniref:hypothetical protein n=1 Tax=Desulfovibrio sp. TaxID=885 RepID=UPI003D0FCCA9
MNNYVTMQSLGSNGRFGNQIFQYAFIRFYARMHELQHQVPPWEGQNIFDLEDPPISVDFPQLKVASKTELDQACANGPLYNVDFWGYFQETDYFSHNKRFFYSLFQPKKEIQQYLDQCWKDLEKHEVIGLHLRYGDYGYGFFFETPLQSVLAELEQRWHTLSSPILYLATDDPRVRNVFKKFSPLMRADIFHDSPKCNCPDYYADFWALSKVNALLIIANSSFSFAAAMLNHGCQEMLRPSLSHQRLIPFTPWASPVLLMESNPWLSLMVKYPKFLRYYNKVRRFLLFHWGRQLKFY